MRLILFLSLVTLSVLVGCQRDKMNSKDLTTVNVKRSLPASLPETGTLPETKEQPSVQAPEATRTLTKDTPTSQPETTKKQNTEQNIKKTTTRSYHIIVASHPREELAQKDVAQLKAKGYTNARIITKDGRYRVSIANNTDKQEGTKQRNELAEQLGQSDIWIMLY